MGTIFLHLIQFLQFVSHCLKKDSFSLPVPRLLMLLINMIYKNTIYYCKKYTSNKYSYPDNILSFNYICRIHYLNPLFL